VLTERRTTVAKDADNGKYGCPNCGGWFYEGRCYDDCQPPECNGICLTGADLGVPEYGGIAYAHPDCPEHGDPLEDGDELYICEPGEAEDLRYVREEDVEFS
jgi:hypothetical protein